MNLIKKSLKNNNNFNFPVYVILDNVRSLYNIGSIFRTSDAVQIKKLMLCGITAYPPRKEIDKTSLGAVENVEWQYYKNTFEALDELKIRGISIVSVENSFGSLNYSKLDLSFPVAFIFGNEVSGISKNILDYSDYIIEIPMYGLKNSLNISVCYGIIIYSFLNRYLEKLKIK